MGFRSRCVTIAESQHVSVLACCAICFCRGPTVGFPIEVCNHCRVATCVCACVLCYLLLPWAPIRVYQFKSLTLLLFIFSVLFLMAGPRCKQKRQSVLLPCTLNQQIQPRRPPEQKTSQWRQFQRAPFRARRINKCHLDGRLNKKGQWRQFQRASRNEEPGTTSLADL